MPAVPQVQMKQSRLFDSGELPAMLPEGSSGELFTAVLKKLNPDVGVKIALQQNLPPALQNSPSKALDQIYQVLLKVSTLEGITYFSTRQDKEEVLFHSSYRIKSPEEKTPLPDLHIEPPEVTQFLAYQEDNSFGKNINHYHIIPRDKVIDLVMTNKTTYRIGRIIPAVSPDHLKILINIRADDTHLYFYGVGAARILKLPGLEKRIQQSFTHRMEALYQWLNNSLNI